MQASPCTHVEGCQHQLHINVNGYSNLRLVNMQLMVSFATIKMEMETKVLLGEKFVLPLYGGQRLATLVLCLHNRNIASKSMCATFTLAALPQTNAAARHHSLRTYL